eukprot:TRINITY_DN111664_c0_g1_i1.p1 TRINITY_DN111664_c0_g1~~TRINITY_DN111664_c0_g1_i1.p1  ORF type:complete len:430 (-),score=53.77 TRINITY_DN111664_c0_g1_i1:13-1302(-)
MRTRPKPTDGCGVEAASSVGSLEVFSEGEDSRKIHTRNGFCRCFPLAVTALTFVVACICFTLYISGCEALRAERMMPSMYGYPYWLTQAKWNLQMPESVTLIEKVEKIRPMMRGRQPSEVLLHTEFNPDLGPVKWCFKNRLVVISSLAKNPNATVWLWFYDPHMTRSNLECFKDLQEHSQYSQRFVIKHFDPILELERAAIFDKNDKQMYADTSLGKGAPAKTTNFSNLRRYLLLYNYGGIWLDTDVIVLRSFTPLAGFDFVYECPQKTRVVSWIRWNWLQYSTTMTNGAVMGSAKFSPFMLQCMQYVLRDIKESQSSQFWKWGPLTLFTVREEAFLEGKRSPYASLPCLWFDAEWALGRPLPGTSFKWGATFGGQASAAEVKVYSDAQGIFAYHFHNSGNWTGLVTEQSLSSLLMRQFETSLGLDSVD